MQTILTTTLEIAYEESGPADGPPVILMHGFPDDVHAYDGVAPLLAASGWRVIVPYLRGYGPTRFRDPSIPRSGQQGALGHDLLSLMDGLSLGRAVLAGYDWGGRAACIVAALWPERVAGLVSIAGTTFRTSRLHCSPPRLTLNTAIGTSGIFTLNADGLAFPSIVGPSVVSCGNCGRRITASTMLSTSEPPNPSTIRILSRFPSIPIDTATGRRREIQHSTTSKPSLRDDHQSRCRRLSCTVRAMVSHLGLDGSKQRSDQAAFQIALNRN
jgi:pimeloyl-ACP methyl ester carboxylesterase